MTFVPGLELSRAFYVEVVRPILDDLFPDLRDERESWRSKP